MLIVISACIQKTSINKKCVFEVNRFEQDFFNTNQDSFDQEFELLKQKYPEFFRDPTIDYKHHVFLNDTMNLIFDSIQVLFKDGLPVLGEIEMGYCNYKNQFP